MFFQAVSILCFTSRPTTVYWISTWLPSCDSDIHTKANISDWWSHDHIVQHITDSYKVQLIGLMVTWPHSSTITLTVMWPQNPIQKTSGHVTYKQNKSDGQTSGLIRNSTSSTAIFHTILKKRVLKDQLPDKFTLFSGRLAWFGSYHRSIPVQKTISLTTFIHTHGFFVCVCMCAAKEKRDPHLVGNAKVTN